jgi:hypothetical protein
MFGKAQSISDTSNINDSFEKINMKFKQKFEQPKGKTRGATTDPCEEDLRRLKVLFSQCEDVFNNCCAGRNYTGEVATIIYQAKKIIDNSNCIWADNPEMYLIVLILWSDLDDTINNANCPRKCECIDCE